MNVDYEGKLIPREKIRTKKKAIVRVVDNMMDHVEDGAAYTGRCAISHSDCLEGRPCRGRSHRRAHPRAQGQGRDRPTSVRSSAPTRAPAPWPCSSWATSASTRRRDGAGPIGPFDNIGFYGKRRGLLRVVFHIAPCSVPRGYERRPRLRKKKRGKPGLGLGLDRDVVDHVVGEGDVRGARRAGSPRRPTSGRSRARGPRPPP